MYEIKDRDIRVELSEIQKALGLKGEVTRIYQEGSDSYERANSNIVQISIRERVDI